MKKTILIGLGIIAVALLVAGCAQQTTQQPPSQQSSTYQVTIKSFAFNPSNLAIKQGDTVVWTNEDSAPHTVTFDFVGSPTLNTGGTFSYTFNQKGTFDYICGIHPSMKARITVT